jgi:hypothetical protein
VHSCSADVPAHHQQGPSTLLGELNPQCGCGAAVEQLHALQHQQHLLLLLLLHWLCGWMLYNAMQTALLRWVLCGQLQGCGMLLLLHLWQMQFLHCWALPEHSCKRFGASMITVLTVRAGCKTLLVNAAQQSRNLKLLHGLHLQQMLCLQLGL